MDAAIEWKLVDLESVVDTEVQVRAVLDDMISSLFPVFKREYIPKVKTPGSTDPALRQLHMDPMFAAFVGQCIEAGMAQKHICKAFVAAMRCAGILVDPTGLPDHKRIREMEVALGGLALAKKGSDLIKLGIFGQLMALMLDGGSMRAGAKFQAGVVSWLKKDGGFERSLIGSIPLRDGTDKHRVDRVFLMFDDMLEAVKAMPFFGVTSEHADKMSMKEIMAGVGALCTLHLCILCTAASRY